MTFGNPVFRAGGQSRAGGTMLDYSRSGGGTVTKTNYNRKPAALGPVTKFKADRTLSAG